MDCNLKSLTSAVCGFCCPLQDIEEFSFITQLAGITDHLSVAMRLAVTTGEEEP